MLDFARKEIVVAKPGTDLRRLGGMLLIGAVAGAAARYYMETRTRAERQQTSLIDWDQARAMALRVSQWEEAPLIERSFREAQYLRLVKQSEPLIAEYLGVELPEPINRVYVHDRREWLEANFTSFEHLFRPIEAIYERNATQNSMAMLFSDVNSKLLGLQMGGLLGFLARRVLGQYDLSLLSPDPATGGALYFVEPNIARVQGQLGLNDEDFRLWIALHETTHAFEFEAYPWVRQHFRDLLQQYFDQLNDQLEGLGLNLPQLLMRLIQNWGSNEHWIEMMLTPQQRVIFEQLQALMSLVEGYGNHVMNAVGKRLLPSFEQIEHRVAQRQSTRTIIEQVFNRITGMDLKLAQYQQGEAFVNAVTQARGQAYCARVWERVEHLPTMEEIKQPALWIARMDATG
ncbi:zinc-dependent metalloprotease [Candidatus Chloroploca sp. M-50]|uniref:Zinc-dependent metalloprotease n=1 Tax=Candidatus Chloroploca mongolica TaxID=2528176 RepID=A0ABS4D8D6_9CHLR|nr:zinc-dependent metalloprotease [Candidatus Chloroploca mongolica]